nr:hypothetical protein [Tanacetum cinerariifolium]
MDQDSAFMVSTLKVPMIKLGVETTIAAATVKEKAKKPLLHDVEKRFGGNAATKKTKRNILRKQYENFTAYSSEDLQQIHLDDLEEMDLRWQMAMLTMRARRFLKNTRRKFSMNGNETIRAPRSQDTKYKDNTRRTMHVETPASAALVSCDALGGYDWSDQAEDGPTNFALMASSSTSSNSKIINKCKIGLGYNDVPPPYIGKVLPTKPDFSILEEFVNESIVTEPTVKMPEVETSEAKASADKPKVVWKNFGPSLIEDWISDSKNEAESKPKIEKKCNPQQDLLDKGVIDSGCSRHMTWNMSYLTNYEEIDEGYVAFGGTKACDDTGKARMETVPGKDYILLPLWTADPLISYELKSSQDGGFQPLSDDEKKVDEDPR